MENGCLVPDWFDGPVIPADLFHDKEDTDVDTGDQQAVDDAEYDDGSSTDSEWSDDSAGILEGVIIMSIVGVLSPDIEEPPSKTPETSSQGVTRAMLLIIDCKYKILENSKLKRSITKSELFEKTELLIGDEVQFSIPNGVSEHDESETTMTYGDVGEKTIGYLGKLLIDVAIIVSQVGFTCAYLIFITENMSTYVPSVSKSHWLLLILPPLYLLTLYRQLHKLAFSSLFAQISTMFAFAVVFWFDFEHYHTISFHPKEFSLKGFPFFFAVSIYCYEGAGMILSLESSLDKDYRHMFKRYFISIISVVTVLYIVFGICGYIVRSSSLNFAMLVKVCLSLSLFFTYPVMLFPVIKLLEFRLLSNSEPQVFQENLLRFILVSITGLVVIAIPNFANLMAIVGATFCALLAFILPGIFHIILFKKECSSFELSVDILLILIGIVGLYSTSERLLTSLKITIPRHTSIYICYQSKRFSMLQTPKSQCRGGHGRVVLLYFVDECDVTSSF
ncbi:Amino acid transporter AVT3C [Nymphon striatum]|nr:Amino acid transporter AVT3C [Nymphon striatum]